VFKVAMIEVDRALREREDLACRMLLTVHDELVFEVPRAVVQDAADVVRDRMEHAIALEVPLRADLGWGANWAEAVPEGH
jgi:DNA polymerase-1